MIDIQYILNQDDLSNHLTYIKHSLLESSSCFLAFAYIKTPGLELIIEELRKAVTSKPVELVIGLPYLNTHPEAIETIYSLVKKSRESSLNLVDYGDWIFHCKLLCFDFDVYSEVLVGSMNITLGGLVHNFEISSLARIYPGSTTEKDVEAIKDTIRHLARPASAQFLKAYRQRFQLHQETNI